MAINTVKELIEELEEYGGHVGVRVRVAPRNPATESDRLAPLVIDEDSVDGEGVVTVQPEDD